MEFIVDSRYAGESLGSDVGIEEVFRPLGLDRNQIEGDFLCGGFAGPNQGAELKNSGLTLVRV